MTSRLFLTGWWALFVVQSCCENADAIPISGSLKLSVRIDNRTASKFAKITGVTVGSEVLVGLLLSIAGIVITVVFIWVIAKCWNKVGDAGKNVAEGTDSSADGRNIAGTSSESQSFGYDPHERSTSWGDVAEGVHWKFNPKDANDSAQ